MTAEVRGIIIVGKESVIFTFDQLTENAVIVSQNDDGKVFSVSLGHLIPQELWDEGIEAVQVEDAVLRSPAPSQRVRAQADEGNAFDAFRTVTVWLADGVRWAVSEAIGSSYSGSDALRWDIFPKPHSTRPPIPGE